MKRWRWLGYPIGGLICACLGILAVHSLNRRTTIPQLQVRAGIGALLGILLMALLLSYPFRIQWIRMRRFNRRVWKLPVFFHLKDWFGDFIYFLRWVTVPLALLWSLALLDPIFDLFSPFEPPIKLWVEFAWNFFIPLIVSIPAMLVCPNRGSRRKVGAFLLLSTTFFAGSATTYEVLFVSALRTPRELYVAVFLGIASAVWITRYTTRKCRRSYSPFNWTHDLNKGIAKF